MNQIVQTAERSLNRVLEFYEKVGTPLGYSPKIKYIDGICNQRPDTIAMVKSEIEMVDKSVEFLSQYLAKTIWQEGYGLNVSDESIAEAAELSKKQISDNFKKVRITKEFESGADILVFEPYLRRNGDDIMAHEVWHLIEKANGVMFQRPYIIEGTATYAMNRFLGQRCDKPFEESTNLVNMLYQGTANIVQSVAGNSNNPYKSMLDNETREQIQQTLILKLKPKITGLVVKLLENEDTRKMALQSLRENPYFKELEGNLSHKGIVQAYRKMGANKLADELEKQDLGILIQQFKMMGF